VRMKRAAPTRYGRKPEGVAALPEYRALTRNYLSEPDPARWAVLADLFEEHGDAGGAALWRRRAAWYPMLRLAHDVCVQDRDVAARHLPLGDWVLSFQFSRPDRWGYVRVAMTRRFPMRLDGGARRTFVLSTMAAKPTYLVERLLGICDHASAIEALPAAKGGQPR